ncbi:hypothetical protein OF83DRAFT_1179307, partial [Amylostereum chailletii]
FDRILRNKTFNESIVTYAVDEVHVTIEWGKAFREAYAAIAKLRALLPRVPILMMTATLSPELEHALLTDVMEFRPGQYRTLRRSIEQPNVRTMFYTLHGGIAGSAFPELTWAATGVGKTLIYCKDYTTC